MLDFRRVTLWLTSQSDGSFWCSVGECRANKHGLLYLKQGWVRWKSCSNCWEKTWKGMVNGESTFWFRVASYPSLKLTTDIFWLWGEGWINSTHQIGHSFLLETIKPLSALKRGPRRWSVWKSVRLYFNGFRWDCFFFVTWHMEGLMIESLEGLGCVKISIFKWQRCTEKMTTSVPLPFIPRHRRGFVPSYRASLQINFWWLWLEPLGSMVCGQFLRAGVVEW